MKINLKELATSYKNIAIVTHTRPDGDALGSSVGLYYGLKFFGNESTLLCDMEPPRKVQFLFGMDKFVKEVSSDYDLIIFSDCGDISRVGNLALDIKKAKTICIDHHQTTKTYCDINHIDPSSASTCQLVLKILEENGVSINEDAANCLYTGLMTDTGNFSHTNVTDEVFEDARRLYVYGANPNKLSRRIFKRMEGNKYKLLAYVLSNTKLFAEGKVSYFYITKEVLSDLGLTATATEGLIDYALSIEGVQIALAVLEADNRAFKISLRSIDGIDVSRVAEHFGGGGHKQAAGCTICGFYEDVSDKLIRQASLYTK